MEKRLAKALIDLMSQRPYADISIQMICESIPVSRRTFYGHYQSKNDLLEKIITEDFMLNAFPIIKSGMGHKGVRAFFKYIQANAAFYKTVYNIDEGTVLQRCLVMSYAIAVENVAEYAHPVKNDEKKINPDVYRLYTHSGVASIVVYWVRSDFSIGIDDISRDTALMMEHPLSFVRDRYLV